MSSWRLLCVVQAAASATNRSLFQRVLTCVHVYRESKKIWRLRPNLGFCVWEGGWGGVKRTGMVTWLDVRFSQDRYGHMARCEVLTGQVWSHG
jgi:hypothetical protein